MPVLPTTFGCALSRASGQPNIVTAAGNVYDDRTLFTKAPNHPNILQNPIKGDPKCDSAGSLSRLRPV